MEGFISFRKDWPNRLRCLVVAGVGVVGDVGAAVLPSLKAHSQATASH